MYLKVYDLSGDDVEEVRFLLKLGKMMSRKSKCSVPLAVLLRRELTNEKIENPDILHGQACKSRKGEDFALVKTDCQRVPGDGVTTFSVFAVCWVFFLSFVSVVFLHGWKEIRVHFMVLQFVLASSVYLFSFHFTTLSGVVAYAFILS